ncbi:MAG: SIS domain-containing protein, partial [Candidatus Thorarchaeota archaeon]|nr:SIS domain-containing protein [Candidatus Thorarchaeota archaeon]
SDEKELKRRHVIFVGAGDSYAVADYGKWAFLNTGMNACSISPTEIKYIPLDSECIVIGVTASGRSLATIDAIRRAALKGAKTIVLTDNPKGRAAEEASEVWITKAGVDSYNVSPASPTTTAMVYLLKIASRIDSQIQDVLQYDLDILLRKGREMLEWAEKEGSTISNMISPGTPLYMISDGPNYIAAQIGMMKFDEFSIIKGIAALREEFCHHHNLSIKNREQVVLISESPITPSDEQYLGILSDVLNMQAYHLYNNLDLKTALAQTIPNTIALQMAAHHTVRRFDPEMSGFKMPHAKAFKIY